MIRSPYPVYPDRWISKIDKEFQYSVENGLPGAVVNITMDGNHIFQKSYGYKRIWNEKKLMSEPEAMTIDNLFDLASLTKIFSTTFLYMKFVEDGSISLDEPVRSYLPTFTGGDKDGVTVKQLLQHNSGLPSSFHFYDVNQVGEKMYSQDREKTISLLPLVPLQNKPGTLTLYSDLNFIMLGIILEKVTGIRQDLLARKYLYDPLGLLKTGYIPLDREIRKEECEATERCGNTRDGRVSFAHIRTETIQGHVHDETAFYSMGQISGHAGLFSKAEDLSILCQLVLNGGSYGTYTLCKEETVRLFTTTFNIDKTYALGFQVPLDHSIYGLLAPSEPHVLGHTGWTGNFFLMDFDRKAIFINLNNKKHTPVVPLKGNLNIFEGDLTPVGCYGGPIQLFYGGLCEQE